MYCLKLLRLGVIYYQYQPSLFVAFLSSHHGISSFRGTPRAPHTNSPEVLTILCPPSRGVGCNHQVGALSGSLPGHSVLPTLDTVSGMYELFCNWS